MRRFAALSPLVVEESGSALRSDARLLLHLIQQYFVIGIKAEDGPSLLRDVKALPADLQFLWTEVLRARLARTDLVGLAHGTGTNDCRLPTPTSTEILQLVEAGSAATCTTCDSPHEPWPTIGSVSDVRSCVSRQFNSVLKKGSSRQNAYDENLRSIARASDNCVIVDRYAGIRLRDNGDHAGITWLGERLLADGVKRIVLVTSRANASDAAIMTAATALTDSKLRAALKVEVLPDYKFKQHAHDRFILLQAGHAACAFTIGKGVEVFEQTTVAQESSFSVCDGGVVGRILGQMSVSVSHHFV